MLRLTSGQWSAGSSLPSETADLEYSLPVLYKSDHFVVVNKRYDLKVNSDDAEDRVTVATLLEEQFPGLADAHTAHGFRFVHRLDYATSGCLCVALTKKGARWASKAFSKHYVTKHYLALVRGHLDPETESVVNVDVAIGVDSGVTDVHKMCTIASDRCKDARNASTKVVLLEHGYYDDDPVSKVLLIPLTGRTHQLRVHCRHLGHCIVGDYAYSDRTDVLPHRMMLHAFRLVIPMKREQIEVIACDPLLPEVDSHWKVSRTFTTYEIFVES